MHTPLKKIIPRILIVQFALAFLCVSSKAEEIKSPAALPPSFGLAMHGKPKYEPGAKNLEYANPLAPKGGTLKIGVTGTFDSLNPFSIKGVPAQGLSYVYDRLMARVYDEPFTLYPLIAEKAEVAEDRSAVTFTLNPAARFHDGSPITTEDVLFSFNTLREHGRPNMRRIYGLVKKSEKMGDRVIRFSFGSGHDRETAMILAMMPVLSKNWWQGRDFEETLLTPPLSSGPYKITVVENPRRIVYQRVKDYWAASLLPNVGHYNVDTLIYDYYRDDTIALEAFKKGDTNIRREFDLAKWNLSYANIDASRIEKREIGHSRPERVLGFIMNTRRAPLNDIRVRKALSLAFDSQWVGKNLFFDAGSRIDSYFPNSPLNGNTALSPQVSALLQPYKEAVQGSVFSQNPGNLKENKTLRERLREADQLLQASGWIIKNGNRINKQSGAALKLEIILNSPSDEKVAINYAKVLKKLGITLEIRMLDAANFQSRKGQYDYDILASYWQNSLSPGTEQRLYWGCKAASEPMSFNFSGICKKPLEDLTTAIADAKTYEELTAYAHAIDRILLSEYLLIPLFYTGKDYVAYDRSVHIPEGSSSQGIVMETIWIDAEKGLSSTKKSVSK